MRSTRNSTLHVQIGSTRNYSTLQDPEEKVSRG